MDIQQKLIDFFADSGFSKTEEIPEQLTYTPELILEKGNELKVFHEKEDAKKLRDSIILRIAKAQKIPGKAFEQYLVFPEKPAQKILADCKLYGLGIYYINAKGEFDNYAEPKQIRGRVKKPQIPNTKIFFSSKQHADERKLANRIIQVQKEANKIPLFPVLVEDDQRYDNNIDNLEEIINDCMDDSQYVLCILEDEYGEMVEQEIRRALQLFEPSEILFFIKQSKVTKDVWNNLLVHIDTQYPLSKPKYTEYTDLNNFEIKFTRRLMLVMKNLYESNGLEYLG